MAYWMYGLVLARTVVSRVFLCSIYLPPLWNIVGTVCVHINVGLGPNHTLIHAIHIG
jgi:uncharacterized membrane protein AbrB (regulator of aidB expression)